MKKARRSSENKQTEFLRTILITQLALAGISPHRIRAIARCDMNTVTVIVRHLGLKAGKHSKGRARHGEKNK